MEKQEQRTPRQALEDKEEEVLHMTLDLRRRHRRAVEGEARLHSMATLAKAKVKTAIDRLRQGLEDRAEQLNDEIDIQVARCRGESAESLQGTWGRAEDLQRLLQRLLGQREVSDFELQMAEAGMEPLVTEYDNLQAAHLPDVLERLDVVLDDTVVLGELSRFGSVLADSAQVRVLLTGALL